MNHQGVDEHSIALPTPTALEEVHAHPLRDCSCSPAFSQAMGAVYLGLLGRQIYFHQPPFQDAVRCCNYQLGSRCEGAVEKKLIAPRNTSVQPEPSHGTQGGSQAGCQDDRLQGYTLMTNNGTEPLRTELLELLSY